MSGDSRTPDERVALGQPIEVNPRDIFSIGALRNLLKATCANAGGMRAWGRLHGITAAYVSRVIDYVRDSVYDIQRKIHQRGATKVASQLKASVPPEDNCEHGVPRRFCTAVHS